MSSTSVSALCHDRVRADGHAPAVTYHDHVTGERTELSVATLDNWASKTANLLAEELSVGPGDTVALVAGPHWTTAAVALGCWKLGACVAPGPAPVPGARVLVAEEAAAGPLSGAGVPLVVVGAGMAARSTGPIPPGALGYGEEVLAFADDYDDETVGVDTPALRLGEVVLTQGNLLAAAVAYGAWGLDPDDQTAGSARTVRVLVTAGPEEVEGLVHGVLGPWVWRAPSVVVRQADPERLWDVVAAERVTAAFLGPALLDRLPAPPGSTPLQHLLCPSGAAPDVTDRATARIGVPVAVGDGLVAAACAATLPPREVDSDTLAWLADRGPTLGVPLPGAEVAVEKGELVVGGPMVAGGEALRTGLRARVEAGPDGRSWVFPE